MKKLALVVAALATSAMVLTATAAAADPPTSTQMLKFFTGGSGTIAWTSAGGSSTADNQALMLAMKKRPYSLSDFKADTPAQPQVRKEFPDAIYWVADVVTDDRGNVYDAFHEKTDLGYTRYSEIINKLDQLGLIDAEYTNVDGRGRSRDLTLNYEADAVLERL